MNIEKQVCSLEQSKILKKLKMVDNVSYFVWKVNDEQTVVVERSHGDIIEKSLPGLNKYYSAWTVAELGEMIGKGTRASEKHWQWLLDCVNSGLSGTVAYNPVALAGFVITAIKNGELTIKDVNNRLNSNRS